MIRLLSSTLLFLLLCFLTLSILACSDSGSDAADAGDDTDNGGDTNVGGDTLPTPDLDCTTVMPGASLADDFVCAHNAIRASLPSPQPVPDPLLSELAWNQELAEYAQVHADTCVFAHSDNTERTNAFGQWVGENLAANTGQGYDPYSVTDLWAAEAVDYDYATNTCADGEVCGHYTQIVWRQTTQIGCAKAICSTLTNTSYMDAEYWVCEYMPGGNINGQRPY
jgi:uncharacterized protein YkwD